MKSAGSGVALAVMAYLQAVDMIGSAIMAGNNADHQKDMLSKQLEAQKTQLNFKAKYAESQKNAAIAELGEKATLQNDLAKIQQKVNSSATERAKTEGEQTVAKAELTEQEKTMQAGRLNTTDLLNSFFDSRNQYRHGRPA